MLESMLASSRYSQKPVNMRYAVLLSSLSINIFTPVIARLVPTCYSHASCSIDPVSMKEAIDLIPSPSHYPDWFLKPDDYRLPAVFEVGTRAQIVVQLLATNGRTDTETLMAHVWPNVKYYAVQMFGDCEMTTNGLSGSMEPVIRRNDGPLYQQLHYRLDMTCDLQKESVITTYTAFGIQEPDGNWDLGMGNLTSD